MKSDTGLSEISYIFRLCRGDVGC